MTGTSGETGMTGTSGLTGPTGPSPILYNGQGIFLGQSGQNETIISANVAGITGSTGISVNSDTSGNYTIGLSDFLSVPNSPTNLSTSSTSTLITLTWNYPFQTAYAFGLMPSITKFYYQIFPNGNSTSLTNFIDLSNTTLNISNSTGTNNVDLSKNYNIFNISTISSIGIWYENYIGQGPSGNILASYRSANPPSAPTNVSLNTTTKSLSWTAPSAETTQTSITIVLTGYDISYNSSGSTIRFFGPITDVSFVTYNNTNTSQTLSTLFPDSPYNFQVRARNSASLTGQYSSPIYSIETNNLTPSSLIFPSPIFTSAPAGVSNIFSVFNNTSINNLLISINSTNLNTTNTIRTKAITWPIQTINTRGNFYTANPNNLYIKKTDGSIISSNNIIDLSGCFTSIGNSIMPNTINSIFIKGTYIDSYASSVLSYRGFYTDLSMTSIDISTNYFTSSPNLQLLDISDNFVTRNILTYRYDGSYNNNVAPTISSVTASVLDSSIKNPVTGITVYNTLDLSINTPVSNIGKYFYKSPVLQYNIVGNAPNTKTETNLSNLDINTEYDNSSNANKSFKNQVTFKNPSVQQLVYTNTNNLYFFDVSLNVIASNAAANSANSIISIPNIIIDQPSYKLAYTTTLNDVSNTSINTIISTSSFFRIQSKVYNTNLSTTSINGLIYDNIKSITSSTGSDASYNNELPIINGKFSFSLTNYNGLDFTNVPIRYSTFVWKMTDVKTAGRINLNFGFSDANETFKITSGINVLQTTTSNTSISIDFNILVQGTPSGNDTNTYSWANGSLLSGESTSQLGGTNTNVANMFCPPSAPSISTNNTNYISYSLPTIRIQDSNAFGYVLLRVGLPSSSPFSFGIITASLTS